MGPGTVSPLGFIFVSHFSISYDLPNFFILPHFIFILFAIFHFVTFYHFRGAAGATGPSIWRPPE